MKRIIVFSESSPSRRPVCFRAGWPWAAAAGLVFSAALIGWCRIAVASVTAARSHYAVNRYRDDSLHIRGRLAFLESQLTSHGQRLGKLAVFEKSLRLNYGLALIPDDVRMAGIGGYPSGDEIISVSSENIIVRKTFALEQGSAALSRQAVLEDSLLTESAGQVRNRLRLWAQTPSICPVEGRLASRFGWRADPMGGYDTRFHMGIDLANSIGTPVRAAADGIVRFIGMQEGFGKVIRIRHEACCLETIYGHMDSFAVAAGQMVKRGEVIGLMGNTGRSTGPHLHFEVRDRGRSVNPQKFILPDSFVVD